MKEYIDYEFGGTDGEMITKCSIANLMEGQSFIQNSRMGGSQSVCHVLLIHGDPSGLFKFLDEIDFEDDEGNQIPFTEMLQSAEDEKDISDIIGYYDEIQDNWW